MTGIFHLVLVQLRHDEPGQIDEALGAIRAMRDIDGVLDVVAGPDISIEGLAGDYTHGVLIRFADETARDRYMEHPAHLAVGKRMDALVLGAVVVDIAAD